jgi:hypothetical protein
VVNSWRYPRSTKRLLRAEALEIWEAFEDEPGVMLEWRRLDRKRSKLVVEDGTVMAEVRDGRVRTVATGDRTYVGQPTALGNLLPRRSRNRGRLGILSDAASDEQVLSVTGYHFNYRATSIVHLSDGPTFHFPVSGYGTQKAGVMWAVDDAGNGVMMFRQHAGRVVELPWRSLSIPTGGSPTRSCS